MKQKLNTLQNMCFDISQGGKYSAMCDYTGISNKFGVIILDITAQKTIFDVFIELNEDLPEQKLQETIDSLICYL